MLWSAPECSQLTAEYKKVRQHYAMVVDRFFAEGYRASEADYKRMRNDVEEARSQTELALLKLEQHQHEVPACDNALQ